MKTIPTTLAAVCLLIVISVCFMTACNTLPQTPPEQLATPKGVGRYNTGIMSSDILRVPFPEDKTVCYLAVEGDTLKSINCVKSGTWEAECVVK